MKKNTYQMMYDDLRQHVGHTIKLNEVWDWGSNSETGVEIRCLESECDGCEPLLEVDNPHT